MRAKSAPKVKRSKPSKPPAAGPIRIGISGWRYKPWRGTFYPNGLPQKNELPYASSMLRTIEINGTFYSLQRPSSFANWHQYTPPGFVFSVKAPRYITHIRRLREIKAPLANFFLSGLLRLNEKLGPILWQFPPNFKFVPDIFESFLSQLPHTTTAAARLIKNCDDRLKGRTWEKIDADRPLRHAIEIRNDTFQTPAFPRLLRKYRAALVIADTAGKWPMLYDLTSDFAYIRLHGAEELYASGYTDKALNDWAAKIRAWSRGGQPARIPRIAPAIPKLSQRDVFVYFDNDVKVHAPFDASHLAAKLALPGYPLLIERPRPLTHAIKR
jgi:uncharacterized protein YecE (DUF72 family)